jgi:hypothetical protein
MEKEAHLPFQEWVIIFLISLIMISLSIITFALNDRPMPNHIDEHILYSSEITVFIDGAVSNPGSYKLKKGDTIRELLLIVKPLPDANLSRIKISTRLKNKQKIHVPSNSMITINIEGAVINPGKYRVPKGTKLVDLIDYAEFYPNSDLTALKKKRTLKNEELIYISYSKNKKQEKKSIKSKSM